MKSFLRKSALLILCVCLAASVFSSCSKKDKYIDFIYPFSGDVNSYDPQVASTSDEYLIIENTFEGLIRIDDEGNIQSGCAESWNISDDGLTYTFKIRKGLKWDINVEKYTQGDNKGKFKDSRLEMLGYEFNPDITAADFVFALQRAVSPETKCPLFSSLSSIENAIEINSGKKKRDTLGVKAVDTYTLEIRLKSPDEAFMEALTSAAAMPCNEEFFNATKGRYGLSTTYTLFNGQFYVNQILESSYLLKKNDYYTGEFPAKAGELTLKIPTDEDKDKTVERIANGYYDAAYISFKESEQLANDDSLTFTPYNDTTLAFVFNTNGEIFQSKTMRQAFCLGFSRDGENLKDYFVPALNLVPSSSKIGANNASKAMGTTIKKQNQEKSCELFKKAVDVLAVNEITVTVLTTPEYEECVKFLIQGIQSGIGAQTRNNKGEAITFTLKVKTLESSEMKTAMAKGEYDMAFVEYKATNDSAIFFLHNSFSGKSGFDSDKLDKELENAEKADTLNKKAEHIKQAESIIIESYSVCPVIWETNYFAQAKGVSSVQFHAGTGRVSFINADRE
ncbi:MAG: peptide ABC transporter substrate-binding protein [Ruminococcaceae bacterium]|nr:peptide ABC transporter substrate-binding protein [Oscillospiraceae bacterium]